MTVKPDIFLFKSLIDVIFEALQFNSCVLSFSSWPSLLCNLAAPLGCFCWGQGPSHCPNWGKSAALTWLPPHLTLSRPLPGSSVLLPGHEWLSLITLLGLLLLWLHSPLRSLFFLPSLPRYLPPSFSLFFLGDFHDGKDTTTLRNRRWAKTGHNFSHIAPNLWYWMIFILDSELWPRGFSSIFFISTLSPISNELWLPTQQRPVSSQPKSKNA